MYTRHIKLYSIILYQLYFYIYLHYTYYTIHSYYLFYDYVCNIIFCKKIYIFFFWIQKYNVKKFKG